MTRLYLVVVRYDAAVGQWSGRTTRDRRIGRRWMRRARRAGLAAAWCVVGRPPRPPREWVPLDAAEWPEHPDCGGLASCEKCQADADEILSDMERDHA